MKSNYSTHTYNVNKKMREFSYKVYPMFLKMSILLNTELHSCTMVFKLPEEGCCGRPTEIKDWQRRCTAEQGNFW